MKGMVFSFLLALALILGSYVLMVRAIDAPAPLKLELNSKLTSSQAQPMKTQPSDPLLSADKAQSRTLSRSAMEQVIDCYAGKPVYLDAEKSRPLYPSCEHLLRIYQGQSSDPQKVLQLLSRAQGKAQDLRDAQ